VLRNATAGHEFGVDGRTREEFSATLFLGEHLPRIQARVPLGDDASFIDAPRTCGARAGCPPERLKSIQIDREPVFAECAHHACNRRSAVCAGLDESGLVGGNDDLNAVP
jgi:hypothetical protein